MTCCEAGIHHCVQNPPADDQFTTTMSIRQRAAIGRQASLDDMQSRPRERQELSGKACVRQSQQQERVARVAERKHGQNDQKALQLARQRRNGSYCGRLRRSLAASNSGLGNEQQHHECNDAGHDREPEQRPISAWCQPEETCREQWTDYGACVVHRAMESKHMSAFSLGREGAEHRITRRASQSFADAIADADEKHVLPGRCKRDQRPHEPGDAVARHDKGFAPPRLIGPAAGEELQHAARRVGRAFDDAERRRIAAQNARDEHRQQRIDGFGGGVGEEARQSQKFDRAWKGLRHGN